MAEKLHVIVVHGLLNSRLKDHYDLWNLARHRDFDGECLARAIAATFRARGTALPSSVPPGLSDAFAADPAKQRAWTAFLSRNRLDAGGASLPEVVAAIAEFAMPPLIGAVQPGFRMVWPAGGPWQGAEAASHQPASPLRTTIQHHGRLSGQTAHHTRPSPPHR